MYALKKQYGGVLNEVDVQVQVSLISLIKINNANFPPNERQKIAAKHLDFVLMNRQTRKAMLVIELDDKSHKLETRQIRDAYVDGILEKANIPILHQKVKAHYDSAEVYDAIISKIFH